MTNREETLKYHDKCRAAAAEAKTLMARDSRKRFLVMVLMFVSLFPLGFAFFMLEQKIRAEAFFAGQDQGAWLAEDDWQMTVEALPVDGAMMAYFRPPQGKLDSATTYALQLGRKKANCFSGIRPNEWRTVTKDEKVCLGASPRAAWFKRRP